MAVLINSCAPPDQEYYQPSNWQRFDYASDLPFEEYIRHTGEQLRQHRVFFDDSRREEEIELVLPFQLDPPTTCQNTKPHNVLLVHGLLDSPFMFRDIGNALQHRCYKIRTVLLPGHGSRPGDLIDVDRQDWIDAVNYGIRSFGETADVSVIGFSLGGLLAANAALEHPDLNAAILISPALQLPYEWIAWATIPLSYVTDWLDVDPPGHPVRFRSMPNNAVAQIYLLAQEFRSKSEAVSDQRVPSLLLISNDDLTVDGSATLEQFLSTQSAAQREAIYFGDVPDGFEDERVRVVSTFLTDEKILNFSHLTLPFAPENPVMGRDGSFKICGEHIGIVDEADAALCLERENNWKGEVNSTDDPAFRPIQRLTYNPFFDEMIDDIDGFIKKAASEQLN